MSRFGWAFINPEMTGAVANGPDKSIQFASGSSQKLSGSSNLTFDYTTNTLYLTGTLRADSLIVSASQILKSGSTIFGDSVGDTHQFTGSIFNTTLISGTVAQFTLITGSTVTGSTARFTTISASVISASTYVGVYATPGGTNTNIQFNSGSTFSGSNNFTYNYSTNNVSLTGALLMSGTAYISETDYIDFDVSASIPSYKNGRVFYDTDTGDLAYYLTYGNQKLEIGQQTVVKVKNLSGSPISKGKLVRIVGGVGDNPLISTASWESDANSANTLGMLMSTVADGNFGYALLNGVITGVNTDPATFTVGQVIYLSSSGDFTPTTPIAPKHTVRLGEVVRAHATVGSIFIKIDNGYELDELHNVYISGPSEGDLLVYDNTNQYWKNNKVLSGSYVISGSLTNLGLFSSSVGVQTAGAITSQSIISSSLGFKTNTTVEAAGNITSQAIISSSNGFQTNSTIDAVGNIRTTNGDLSSSVGVQTGGFLTVSGAATIRGGLTVTGSSFVQALSSSGLIQASSLQGDGLNITGIQGTNVSAVGDDYTIQYKDVSTGALTGSANLLYNTNNTLQISASAIIYPTSTKNINFSIGPTDYFVFVSGTAITGTFGASTTGRVIRIYNYGLDTVFLTGSGISGFIGSGGSSTPNITQGTNPRTTELMYFSTTNRWLVISTGN